MEDALAILDYPTVLCAKDQGWEAILKQCSSWQTCSLQSR